MPSRSKPKSTPSVPKKPSRATAYHVHEQNACQLCQGSHFLFQCSTFKAQSLEQRSATVQRLKACLSLDHFDHSCPSRKTCRECNQHHHTLLHRTKPTVVASFDRPSLAPAPPQAVFSARITDRPESEGAQGKEVIMKMDRVMVDDGGRGQRARALIDDGASTSFITSRLVNSLKASKIHSSTQCSGLQQTHLATSR